MAQYQIAFDEAGNTGANLLDPEQQVFVLASVNVPEDEAASLVSSLRGNAPEAHFARLRRSGAGQQRIVDALNSEILRPDRLRLSVYHKPFMVTTKIVDFLIESMAHEDGFDLYERGANLGLANMWHIVMPTVLGSERFHELQQIFVRVFRERSWVAIMRLHRYVDRLYEEFEGHFFRGDLAVLLRSIERIGWKDYALWNESDIDPAIPAVFDLGCYWTETLDVEFDIIHDHSKPIEKEQKQLELMMSTESPTTIIGYDRRKHAFPIRATGIQLVDSHTHPEVQLADLLASAVAYARRTKMSADADGFANDIAAADSLSGDLNQVWPEKKVTPQELGTEEVGGVNALDHIVDFLRERKTHRRAS